MALAERARNRVRARVAAIAGSGLATEEAQREAIAALRPVGFDRWCWPLTDPGTALSTSGIAEFDLWREVPRIAALEEHGDVTSKPGLVHAERASISLSAATGGDLARSRRWRECLRPYGVGDELMTACRDRHGCWGSVELMRSSDDPPFAADEVELLHELAPVLAALIRSGLRESRPALQGPGATPPPATLIVDAELRPTSWTPAFKAWLAELPTGPDTVPPAVFELGTRVLAPPAAAYGLPASVRVRTRGGRWATLEGAPLEGADRGHAVITIRSSTADEVFDLLARAYDLTRRERQLVALVLDGLGTKQLAAALCISPHTVQDHLKAIFAKTHVRSRRELVSHLAGLDTVGA
ncbi:MAG TPA: helix-turn-helix transcriptional regulator [Gaiellaceae bacterium]|jgi:DNA-binding CsgD family transcriptional regulator|nr:helix-turn-helix transcriptional regulator [Gaiellaceae bacterium]